MKFYNYLNEANIVTDDKFIQSVEAYVDKNNIKDLKFVIQNKNKIPKNFKNGGVYYRGMIVNVIKQLLHNNPKALFYGEFVKPIEPELTEEEKEIIGAL